MKGKAPEEGRIAEFAQNSEAVMQKREETIGILIVGIRNITSRKGSR